MSKTVTVTEVGGSTTLKLTLPDVVRLPHGDWGIGDHHFFSLYDSVLEAWEGAAAAIALALKFEEEANKDRAKDRAKVEVIADFIHEVSRGNTLWGSQANDGAKKLLELIKGLGD